MKHTDRNRKNIGNCNWLRRALPVVLSALLLCSLWILFQPLVIGTTAVIVWVGITLLLAGITAFSLALQLRNAHHCLHSGR